MDFPGCSTGSEVQCLVVDFQSLVVDLLRLPRHFEDIAFSFEPDQPFALPHPHALLTQVSGWIQAAEEGSGLEFYSAEGGPPKVVPRLSASKDSKEMGLCSCGFITGIGRIF